MFQSCQDVSDFCSADILVFLMSANVFIHFPHTYSCARLVFSSTFFSLLDNSVDYTYVFDIPDPIFDIFISLLFLIGYLFYSKKNSHESSVSYDDRQKSFCLLQ